MRKRSLDEPRDFGQYVGNAAIYGERFQQRLEKILPHKADLDSEMYRNTMVRNMLEKRCAVIANFIFQLFGNCGVEEDDLWLRAFLKEFERRLSHSSPARFQTDAKTRLEIERAAPFVIGWLQLFVLDQRPASGDSKKSTPIHKGTVAVS